MKTVFSNDEIPHLWAHGAQEHARNSSKSYWYNYGILYSYNEPIGRRMTRKGRTVFLFRDFSYSITTSGHQSGMRMAVPSGAVRFTVKHITRPSNFSLLHNVDLPHKLNLEDYRERIKTAAIGLKRARSSRDWKLTSLTALVAEANAYAAEFGYKPRFIVPDDAGLNKLLADEQAAKERERKRIAKAAVAARKDAEERITKWIGGEDVHIPHSVSEAFGRMKGEELETSLGARVPLEHVKRAMPIVKRLIERGEAYQRNGHSIPLGNYVIDSIDTTGTLRAGCHTFGKAEVLRIAALLGV